VGGERLFDRKGNWEENYVGGEKEGKARDFWGKVVERPNSGEEERGMGGEGGYLIHHKEKLDLGMWK